MKNGHLKSQYVPGENTYQVRENEKERSDLNLFWSLLFFYCNLFVIWCLVLVISANQQ
jgi:hypothetical protein